MTRDPFDGLPDSYLATDAGGVIYECNRAAAALLERPRERLVGRALIGLVAAPDRPAVRAVLRCLGRGRITRMELELRLRRGRSLAVALTAGAPGAPLCWLLRDSAPRDRRQELCTELNDALQAGELRRMATELAHEMRQPLTAIVSYAQTCIALFQTGQVRDDEVIVAMQDIIDQGRRADHTLRRLHQTLIETGRHRRTVDVNGLVGAVAAFVQRKIGVQPPLYLELAAQPCPVTVDPAPIQQVLLSLFCAVGGWCDGKPVAGIVVRTARRDDATVWIVVTETAGPTAGRVGSRRFAAVRPAAGRPAAVELAFCRRVVEGEGGCLRLLADRHGGIAFRLSLPLGTEEPIR